MARILGSRSVEALQSPLKHRKLLSKDDRNSSYRAA